MRLQATQEELVLVALAEGVPAHARVFFDCVLYIADVTGMPARRTFASLLLLLLFVLCWSQLQTKPSCQRVPLQARIALTISAVFHFLHQRLTLLMCS